MNFLIGGRSEGKTTKLIYTSEVTRFPIVTHSKDSVNNIKLLAQKLGCDIPEPLSLNEYNEWKRVQRSENILLDNMDFMLDKIFNEYFGCKVVCGVINHEKKGDV